MGRWSGMAATGVRLVVGVVAATVTAAWAVDAAPVVTAPPVAVGSIDVADHPPLGQPIGDALGRIQTFLGCADGFDAASLDSFFAERHGPLIGWDNPHVTPLGPDRWLWLVHDTYLDYVGGVNDLDVSGPQIQNAAFVQTGTCFTIHHSGEPSARTNFETGDERILPANFLWPLGSEVDGDRIRVFWGETTNDATSDPKQGITRYPIATWLASYDVETLERRSFEPAPDPGIDPVYGFAVASDDTHSYLFGNGNNLNFSRQGGYDNGPFESTRTYLARVPKGRLDANPTYWDGARWSDDADDAQPISERFYAENTMQPRYLDGRWISVTQKDGFFSREIHLDVADHPWGPWTTAEGLIRDPRPADVEKNSYQPIILPWSSRDAGVQIMLSENAVRWLDAVADSTLYRPAAFRLDWPTDETNPLALSAGGSPDGG